MKKIIDRLMVRISNDITIGVVLYSKKSNGWDCGTGVLYSNKTMCRLLEDFKLYHVKYK